MRNNRAILILTPSPGYYENWHEPAAQYRALFGEDLALRPWTEPGDMSGFDLILPLLAWGYQRSPGNWYERLTAWRGRPFANNLETLRWNTDKEYLLSLESSGVPIVPTRLASALDEADLDAARSAFGNEVVIKPSISGGADGTYRLGVGERVPDDVRGKRMLVQPLMPAIATEGEYSLFHFAGRFSHAIVKRPASGDFRVQEQFGGREESAEAPASALALAQTALAAAPEPALYARTDMVRGEDGRFRLMELELIEPSLFLSHAPDGGASFAEAVRAWGG